MKNNSNDNEVINQKREKRKEAHEKRMKRKHHKDHETKSHPDIEKYHQRKKREEMTSKVVGLVLASIQVIASLFIIGSLIDLGMLPTKYFILIVAVLVIFCALTFAGALVFKKNTLVLKILSIILSVILFVGSFFIFKASGTIEEISGGSKKVDKMVVAVLATDTAEDIQDTARYNFGIQYQLKAEQTWDAIQAINDEVGITITTTEYTSLQEQAEMLLNREVEAIIYNDAFTSVIETEFEDFSDQIKIIYTYEIETEVENLVLDMQIQEEPFTVYISGIDVYGEIETNSRSDVNIIAEVNPQTNQVLLVTTPRDYYVELPGVSYGMKDKLTHAGIYGVDVSMATLGQLYDTEIEFYVRLNFTSLIEMVDALGGIDVYSEYAFTTSKNSGLVMDVVEGMNHFNGKQALAFSRERKNVPGGDLQRGKDQQAVITAMLQKAISPSILLGANDILKSISGNIDTNMTESQIQSLIKYQLSTGASWKVKSMAAESYDGMQACYSSGYTLLSVQEPVEESVLAITQAIDAVENGEVFEDSTVVQ